MHAVLSWPRLLIVAGIGVAGALYFWLGSRYPDLDAKALMMGTPSLADAITVWPLFEIRPEFALWKKIALGTLNWLYANYKGMSFGVFFGGIFLTVLGYFKVPRTQNKMQNTVLGFFLGAPLGVCVNCAAPIFKGMLRSRRTETAFAAMLSSPTMNVVVLTMVFSFFPFYIGVVKVIFTLIMVMIVVPLLSHLLGSGHLIKDYDRKEFHADELELPTSENSQLKESWWQALYGGIRDFLANLLYIAVRTVPLMFLAGFIGAIISQTLPLNLFISNTGNYGIILAALLGVLLPIPIAVDVILVSALYSQGMDISIVLVLLCSLGIYSVYSMMITWQSASKAWAIGLALSAFLLACAVGFIAKPLHQHLYIRNNLDSYAEQRSLFEKEDVSAVNRFRHPDFTPYDALTLPAKELVPNNAGLKITRQPLLKNTGNAQNLNFKQLEGYQIGLVRGFRYGIRDYPDPFWIGRGTAAADFDQDGWTDIAFGTSRGIALYRNRGGYFEIQEIANKKIFHLNVYALAFVDIDNDGWQDLFFSTFNRGNYWVKNNKGKIEFFKINPITNGGGIITVSPSFYDLNLDGRLDIINGNMALGIVTGIYQQNKGRQNTLSMNLGQGLFESRTIGRLSGETMASLAVDLDGDQAAEIIFNNDFVVPDEVLSGRLRPGQEYSAVAGNKITIAPYFSMSSDAGDIDGDLDLDLLIYGTTAQQKWVGQGPIDGKSAKEYNAPKWSAKLCEKITNSVVRENCLINRNTNHLIPFYQKKGLSLDACTKIINITQKQDCLVSTMWLLVTNENLHDHCEERFGKDRYLREVCQILTSRGNRLQSEDFPEALSQANDNFIYRQQEDGNFTPIERLTKDSTHPGGWTWSANFIDYDNDGDLDVFNAEGSVREGQYGWNVLLENNGKGQFSQKQFSRELSNDFNLFSFVKIDFDNDGDLDIIGNSSTGPIQVYINNASSINKSVTIKLRDAKGNHFAVGSRVIAAVEAKKILRVLKASGGYQSSQPSELHFGTGKNSQLDQLQIDWPDGSQSKIATPLPTNSSYVIERTK